MKLLEYITLIEVFTIAAADWLVADTYSDNQCAIDDLQLSLMKQTGVCLALPSNFPIYASYKISSCSENADSVAVSINLYTAGDCSGFPTPHSFSRLPVGCHNGTKLSCQKNPTAIDQGWPALGIYVQDSTCSNPTALVALNPGCSDIEMVGFSTEVSCTDTAFTIAGFNGTTSCQGQPNTLFDVELDTCWQLSSSTDVPDIIEQGPIWEKVEELLASGLIQINRSDFYYYADCGGASNLPGVDTSSAETSGHDDDDKYSGLGVIGLSVIIVISVLVAALCCVCLIKHYIVDKKRMNEDFQESILNVGS